MILAAAQTQPVAGDVPANVDEHCRLIRSAAEHKADLIVFPELSLSGYGQESASAWAFTPEDSRLQVLQKLSAKHKIIVIAGAPIRMDAGLYIGSFILYPDGSQSIYTKQFLHSHENRFFEASFSYNPVISLGQEQCSLAICLDIDQPQHVENAHRAGSSLYIPSLFFTADAMSDAYNTLKHAAAKYSMNILTSNYSGDVWGQQAGGKSAFWNKNGERVADLGETDAGLLLIDDTVERWNGKTIVDPK
ncbi:MAG: carbon-nitrogen hydrolase family protein [candidate division KSB1 bacterium]|nr:carbon-nitrogen hydrolase family protein [candidate division KSB1 bacterium]